MEFCKNVATNLSDTSRSHGSSPLEQILSRSGPVQRLSVLLLCGHKEEGHPDVVLQVLADIGQVGDDWDVKLVEGLFGTDSGEQQDVRTVQGASAEDYLK